MLSRSSLALKWSPSYAYFLLAVAVLVAPALWFGPWVPFPDAVGFVALNSYPATLSYGPDHFYLFQFTYILPHVLSRLFTDVGLGVPAQILVVYLIQALVFLGVVWRLLERYVANPRMRCLGLALGALGFWDGVFLWGGPLAYSLAAALLAVATFLSIREADAPERSTAGYTAALVLLSMVSHPFGAPFALVLLALRLVFCSATRGRTVLTIGAVLFFATIIRLDSPEALPSSLLLELFGILPHGIWERMTSLFTWNADTSAFLFGIRPAALSVYFALLGGIHLAGVVTAPIVAILEKRSRGLRMLAVLGIITSGMYFWSRENVYISLWPQRILEMYSAVAYASGIVFPTYLYIRWRSRRAEPAPIPLTHGRWAFNALPALLLILPLAGEFPIMKLGVALPRYWAQARQSIIDSGLTNVALYHNVEDIKPFYLQAVQLLLFSDRLLIERKIRVYTDWHTLARHNSRLPEEGQERYQLQLVMTPTGELVANLKSPPATGWGAAIRSENPKVNVHNTQGTDGPPDAPFYWVGDGITFALVVGSERNYDLSFHAIAGPANPDLNRTIALKDLSGESDPVTYSFTTEARPSFRVHLKPGPNLFRLVVVSPTAWIVHVPGDARKHMIRVQELELVPAGKSQ